MNTPQFDAPSIDVATDTDTSSRSLAGNDVTSLRDLPLHRPFAISDGANIVHWRSTDHVGDRKPRCELHVIDRGSNPLSAAQLAERFLGGIGAELTQGDCSLIESIETEFQDKLRSPNGATAPTGRAEFDGLLLVALDVEACANGVTIATAATRFSSKNAVQSWLNETGLIHQLATGHVGGELPPTPTAIGLEVAVLTRHGEVLLGARNDAGKTHDGYIQAFPGGYFMEHHSWNADGQAADGEAITRNGARAILADELGMAPAQLGDRALDQMLTPVNVLSSFGSCHRSGADATGVYTAVQAVATTDMTAEELIAQYSQAGERDEASGVVAVKLTPQLLKLLGTDEPVSMREILATSTENAGRYRHLANTDAAHWLDQKRSIRPNSLSLLLAVSDLRQPR